MKKALLQVLSCPSCRSMLKLANEENLPSQGDIEEGTLDCVGCLATYQIDRGVPILVSDPKAAGQKYQNFTFQWQLRFSGKAEPAHLLWGKNNSAVPYKVRKSGIWYLDCGCGSGELIRGVALSNPTIQALGMDISESIRYAQERDRQIPNLHYVQGDIVRPPLKAGSFHFILSLGVLHHTPDPQEALRKSAELLDAAGFLTVWLYPDLEDLRTAANWKEYRKWRRYYFFRDSLFLKRAHFFNHRVLLGLCKLVSLSISPFQHILDHATADFRTRHRSNTFILFDNLAATHQHRPRKAEVMKWLLDCGFGRILHSFERGGLYTATLRKNRTRPRSAVRSL